MEKFFYNKKIFRDRRRDLRRKQTPAEKLVWQLLRNRKFQDLRFLRQFSIGPYILDFYCPELKLAIELDGEIHDQPDAKIYDEERTNYLSALNIMVVRFKNNEVIANTKIILETISQLFPLS